MRRSSRRATRTQQKDVGNMSATAMEDLFWELGNYKKTVKRVDDGAILCDDIYRMISERAEIEAKYARKLTAWEEKWKKQTENGPLYATMKNAMLGVLREAGGRAKIHMDCYGMLQNQVLESIKQWKNESYHKNFMGNWKETKEVDEEFARAQKPWAEAFGKVQRAKKNYHAACKACQNASQALKNAEQDANMTKEKREKLQNNEDKHENIVGKMRKKYEEKLQRIGPINTSYEEEMTKVFDKCQRMEEKKLQFVQKMMVEYHKSINITDDPRFNDTLKDMLESAYNGNVKHDLTWWSESYGADMPRNWPQFEEPGESVEASAPAFSKVDQSENDPMSTYQVPRSQQPSSIMNSPPYNGVSNPFESAGSSRSDDEWDDPPPVSDAVGVPVRALYVYNAVEDDELSFNAGDIFTKLSEEDAQGWCRGRCNGKEGLYPANYVEQV